MRRSILIAVVALIVGLPQQARATPLEFIQSVCLEAVSNPISEGICIGYVSGVADAENNTGKFCLPLNTSNDDLMSVVKSYMRQKPAAAAFLASKDHNASVLVGLALMEKFPCN